QFSEVKSNLAYLTPSVSYAAGEIELTLVETDSFAAGTGGSGSATGGSGSATGGFVLPGAGRNENDVARSLNSIYAKGGNALTSALLTASQPQAENLLAQL
ncbi:TPA: hypothetical protein ACYLN4_009052, partial [Burkholderia lata]